MKKWQWLFVDGSENKSQISAAGELLLCAKMGQMLAFSRGLWWKVMVFPWNKRGSAS
jgi:hypothetical protein